MNAFHTDLNGDRNKTWCTRIAEHFDVVAAQVDENVLRERDLTVCGSVFVSQINLERVRSVIVRCLFDKNVLADALIVDELPVERFVMGLTGYNAQRDPCW